MIVQGKDEEWVQLFLTHVLTHLTHQGTLRIYSGLGASKTMKLITTA